VEPWNPTEPGDVSATIRALETEMAEMAAMAATVVTAGDTTIPATAMPIAALETAVAMFVTYRIVCSTTPSSSTSAAPGS
jgi:hypothetical protein